LGTRAGLGVRVELLGGFVGGDRERERDVVISNLSLLLSRFFNAIDLCKALLLIEFAFFFFILGYDIEFRRESSWLMLLLFLDDGSLFFLLWQLKELPGLWWSWLDFLFRDSILLSLRESEAPPVLFPAVSLILLSSFLHLGNFLLFSLHFCNR